MNKIIAPKGKVFRAFMNDINPFCSGLVRRVLIDEYGLVFIPTYGWSNLQGDYPIKVLPEPIEMFDSHDMWGCWWEKKAWQNKAWSWCYMFEPQPEFYACQIQGNSIFAA